MNKNTKHVWVIKNKKTGQFFNKNTRYMYTSKITNAYMFPTRHIARCLKEEDEMVFKYNIPTAV